MERQISAADHTSRITTMHLSHYYNARSHRRPAAVPMALSQSGMLATLRMRRALRLTILVPLAHEVDPVD